MKLIWPHGDVWQGISFDFAVINKDNGKPFSIFHNRVDADFYLKFLQKTYANAEFAVIVLENQDEVS